MTGTFNARIRELQRRVGSGTLSGHVVVDQIYAQDQHENPRYKHDDGSAGYLRIPLEANADRYLERIARGILDDGGRRAMADSMVDLATSQLRRFVPVEYGNLSRSGAAHVYDEGSEIFHRPAAQRRLSKSEIDAEIDGEPGL
jgi:hypothetical protein